MDVDAPKGYNIKPYKKIEESKSEVSWSKEEVKEINFYFSDSLKKTQKILKAHLMKVSLITKF